MESGDAGKGGARGDAVDEDKAFPIADPLVPQRRVLFLASRVEHLEHAALAIDDDLFAIRVFNRRIILRDESAGTCASSSVARGEGGSRREALPSRQSAAESIGW